MNLLVKDLMVPLSEYATVPKTATLSEAVMALEKSQQEFDQNRYRHRAVLIYDENNKIIGKVSQLDILRSLEPKYDEMLTGGRKSFQMGFTRKFQKSMLEQLKLWDAPLDHICQKAAEKKVESFMTKPEEGEFIEAEANLNEGIHQLVLGHHQSLLVTSHDTKEIIGILRLTDVFEAVAKEVAECKL
ncbi:MAG: HPP family protein [Thermodesulfobacteriota bacterium]